MEAHTTRRYKIKAYFTIIILLLIPSILILLPVDYFDKGQSLCISVLLFDKECYACGMTKAIMNIIHFDFSEALYHNVLGFIVFPLLVYTWWQWIKKPLLFLKKNQ